MEALQARMRGNEKREGTNNNDDDVNSNDGGDKRSAPPPLPPFTGTETSDPLLNNLWGWLLPAGVGIDAGGSGRPDARWVLPPREIAWVQHSEGREPNARVSLLTLDDDDDDGSEGGEDGEKGEKEGEELEEQLLLVLWLERDVARGEALTLDWSFEVPGPHFRSSVRRAASLVARLKEERWSEPGVREQLAAAVAAAAAATPPAGSGGGGRGGGGAAAAAAAAAASQSSRSGRAAASAEQQKQRRRRQSSPRTPASSFPGRDDDDDDRSDRSNFLIWTDYPVFSEWLDALDGGGEERGKETNEERSSSFSSSSSSSALLSSSSRGATATRRLKLRRTGDRSLADFILTRLPLPSFEGEGEEGLRSGQLCNQFPFEGALVRKDLLPATARSAFLRRRRGDDDGEAAGGRGGAVSWPRSPDGLHPPWLPPTYDLSIELHRLLKAEAARRPDDESGEEKGAAATWILKPAQASRSLGLAVSSSPATLAAFAMRAAAGGDRVAQRYVERPVLTKDGKKFDLRLYVVVRSFGGGSESGSGSDGEGSGGRPRRRRRSRPSASLYSRFHAREAPRRYCPPAEDSKGLISQSVFGTVACYNEGAHDGGEAEGGEEGEKEEEEEGRSPFFPRHLVDEMLLSRNYDPRAVARAVASLAKKVVEAGGEAVGGPWPRSRAVYGLDVVLDESDKTSVEVEEEEVGRDVAAAAAASKSCATGAKAKATSSVLVPTPRLLEVNFAPDLAVAAGFNPALPGLLLQEMLRESDDEEGEESESGMFLRLF